MKIIPGVYIMMQKEVVYHMNTFKKEKDSSSVNREAVKCSVSELRELIGKQNGDFIITFEFEEGEVYAGK